MNYNYKTLPNARDFGGIKTRDSKTIKGNIIIRSSYLNKLKAEDAKKLCEINGLKTVIDLRSQDEINKRPDYIIDGVKYEYIPFFDDSSMEMTSGMGSDVLSALKKSSSIEELKNYVPDLNDVYRLMARDNYSTSQISACIKRIINNRNGSVLFHCTAGKDRTGVTAAILLKMLNVSDDIIMEDYLFTNNVSVKKSVKFSRLARIFLRNKELAEKIRRVFLAEKEFLKAFFDTVNEIYGSFESYLEKGLNITAEEIDSFKNYILE